MTKALGFVLLRMMGVGGGLENPTNAAQWRETPQREEDSPAAPRVTGPFCGKIRFKPRPGSRSEGPG
jgi:hypothetical protein